jgi:hypothetical protein
LSSLFFSTLQIRDLKVALEIATDLPEATSGR